MKTPFIVLAIAVSLSARAAQAIPHALIQVAMLIFLWGRGVTYIYADLFAQTKYLSPGIAGLVRQLTTLPKPRFGGVMPVKK